MAICILVWAMCRSPLIGNAVQYCDVPFVIVFYTAFGLRVEVSALYETVTINISFYIPDVFITHQEGKGGRKRRSKTSMC